MAHKPEAQAFDHLLRRARLGQRQRANKRAKGAQTIALLLQSPPLLILESPELRLCFARMPPRQSRLP